MRKKERSTVAGIRAPRPRPTPWAALLLALTLTVVFLAALGIRHMIALLLG